MQIKGMHKGGILLANGYLITYDYQPGTGLTDYIIANRHRFDELNVQAYDADTATIDGTVYPLNAEPTDRSEIAAAGQRFIDVTGWSAANTRALAKMIYDIIAIESKN